MTRTAVIAGVGPGLGESLARKFVAEGCQVGLFARSEAYLEELADDLGDDAVAVPTDITDPDQVEAGFETVRDAFGPVDVLVNHASGGAWRGLQAIPPEEFEWAWRVSAYGALLCSQAAVDDMLADDGGTIIFTGATSAVRGREGAIGFSAAKFAVRGMAESMARELGPEGIHVAHVVIDGGIRPPRFDESDDDRDESEFLDPDAVADSYWHLVTQDRSSWTLELDLRPHVEEF
ncbi:short-chain dehydrogenase/reductase SDR [Haloterrigena turkmenica DSM 5511]|uniref:Short-chain dehydrogenase/reductase SDR n=1 Tax=Haloterrigena turkmenica (strain ATCC 51198 / DSM 5511 / JCM 9101 / NCIMB 13204 / VKM B-1734 / 4k) TaxID=543526 RepID=D2RTX2_HALTV|nr:SDR family oxidoreductase [Haloterrigena turkmenica]ADB61073.1 short-chain dehydrogenase/reductase SDR [Haloterrigena turkmenica DSM 5511]